MTTLNPIPVCPECKNVCRRIATTAGKGRYGCTTVGCPNQFKRLYVRGSTKKEGEDVIQYDGDEES